MTKNIYSPDQIEFNIPVPAIRQMPAPAGFVPFDNYPELDGFVALDLETKDPGIARKMGSSWAIPGEGRICGFSIAPELPCCSPFYVGVGHAGGNSDPEKAFRWLKAQAAKPNVTFVYANAMYDMGWLLTREGIDPVNLPIDVQLMAALLDSDRYSYKLDNLMKDYLGRSKGTQGLRERARDRGIINPFEHMDRLATWEVAPYGVDDAVGTIDLYKVLLPMLQEQNLMRVFDLERECLLVGRDMKWRGVRVDVEQAMRNKKAIEDRRDAAISKIKELTGINVTAWDNNAIGRALQIENPKLEMEKTSTGVVSVRAAVIEAMNTPVSAAVQEMRKTDKAISTFFSGYIEDHVTADGRIHAEFHPSRRTDFNDETFGAGPGRWSCVAAWTPIETSMGPKRIDEIKVGDLVWTHNERYRPVLAKLVKGVDTMLRFTFSNGDVLDCTKKHRFLLSCGKWITAGELYDNFKNMGSESDKSGGCDQPLPTSRLLDDGRDCTRIGDDGPKCDAHHKSNSGHQGTKVSGVSKVLQIEEWREQSDEGQVWTTSSQLEGGYVRPEGLYDPQSGEGSAICASTGNGASAGPRQAAFLLRGSSYRWQWREQCAGQSGASDAKRPRDSSCPPAPRGVDVQITSCEVLGGYEVHDIAVMDDESYLACGVFSHNSSGPNLTNVPRRDPSIGKPIRSCFLPEEGEDWMKGDYSSQEPRLTTHFAFELFNIRDKLPSSWRNKFRGVDEMVAKYLEQPTLSMHKAVAKEMGIDIVSDKRTYDMVKQLNLGIIYGMQGRKFCMTVGLPTKWITTRSGKYIEVAGDEGQELMNRHKRLFPWVTDIQEFSTEVAKQREFVTTILGRRIRFKKRYSNGDVMDTYKALNGKVQGSAADQMKTAQVMFRRAGITPLVVVHDDTNISKPKGEAGERLQRDVAEIMAHAVELSVPSLAEFKIGKNWGEVD